MNPKLLKIPNQSIACCGYGTDGNGASGFDCAQIPGASKNTINSAMVPGGSFCGRMGLATTNPGAAMTVCSEY